jgi:hypothetical protein
VQQGAEPQARRVCTASAFLPAAYAEHINRPNQFVIVVLFYLHHNLTRSKHIKDPTEQTSDKLQGAFMCSGALYKALPL